MVSTQDIRYVPEIRLYVVYYIDLSTYKTFANTCMLDFLKVSGHVLSSFEIICAMMHLPSINTTLERLFLMLLCRFFCFYKAGIAASQTRLMLTWLKENIMNKVF